MTKKKIGGQDQCFATCPIIRGYRSIRKSSALSMCTCIFIVLSTINSRVYMKTKFLLKSACLLLCQAQRL